jgi:hypothetical protein
MQMRDTLGPFYPELFINLRNRPEKTLLGPG